ncbi:MAG: hypothetical protein IKZ53_06155 [Selenomonadaceae bacterium]|nr:hypothetical protein [Selenomonadaceae bacterium]
MDKNFKMKVGAGIAALAVVVTGGGWYYFHGKSNAPDTAITAVTRSIEKHDVKGFHNAVDIDSLLDSGYAGFVEGLISFDNSMTLDAKDAIKTFAEMLRAPLMLSMKSAIDSYVATGDPNLKENVGVSEIIQRTGLNDIEVRSVKNIQLNDANRDEAFADVIIYQPELGREFAIQIILALNEDNKWQITRIQNFQEYVAQIAEARRAQLDEYLAKAGEINARHDVTIREAEQKYGSILSLGSLTQDKTRSELKTLMNDVIKADWAARKEELFSLRVPKNAETLHSLYMNICDLSIAAAQDYARWMDDKNSATIKSAEEKLHQVQTLMTEASAIAKRMTK